MDEDQLAVNEAAPEAVLETPTNENEVLETERTETEEPASESVEEPKVQDEQSKKTASSRIRELNAELKAEREKAKSLADQVAEFTGSIEPRANAQQFQPQYPAGAEITEDQYRSDIMRSADALVQLRLEQQKMLDRVNRESSEAIKAHPMLDPDHEDFDNELSESVTKATLAFIRANPGESVKKFTDALMKPYERSLAKAVGQEQVKIAKQVTESALRPTQVRSTEKRFEDLDIHEMEEKLGIIQP